MAKNLPPLVAKQLVERDAVAMRAAQAISEQNTGLEVEVEIYVRRVVSV